MCGIAGIVDFSGRKVEARVIDDMVASIRHRGPDDHGHYVQKNVGFGHSGSQSGWSPAHDLCLWPVCHRLQW